jgi:tRNA-2-methylthio-N6-dimethylallyladenosine synthase
VPSAEQEVRLARLQALLREQQESFARSKLGAAMPVLFTGPGRHPGQVAGRSPWLQPVHLAGPSTLIGSVAEVRIEAALPNSLAGSLAPVASGFRQPLRAEESAPA